MWQDCPDDSKRDLVLLAKGAIKQNELPAQRRQYLLQRGFARVSGSDVVSDCRLMSRYATTYGEELNDLRRMFGTPEAYVDNVQAMLDHRLAHVRGMDNDLRNYIGHAIQRVREPALSLLTMRNVADRAIGLVFAAEAPGWQVPESWRVTRTFEGSGPLVIAKGNRGGQCKLLWEITDDDKRSPLAQFVTRPTAVLVDAIKSAGDFGNHYAETTAEHAAATCLLAIEMAAAVTRDLVRRG